MTPEQQLLSDQIKASTDAFLRGGGTITKLDYAGVPVDDEYGRPVHVPARAETPIETVPQWCERVAAAPPAPTPATKAEICEHFRVPVDEQALADLIADMRPQQEAYIIAQLREIRRDARRWMARLDRVAA